MIEFESAKSRLIDREYFLGEIIARLPERHVLLSTCNRVELYSDDQKKPTHLMDLNILYHLFRVVSGLESSLIGETQIQRQVKDAYLTSVQAGTITRDLHLLFQRALRTGKRVRTETEISRGAASHSQVAFNIIRQFEPYLASAQITILGVNHLNFALVRYLVKHGAQTIFVANRTMDKAKQFASYCGGKVFPLNELPLVLMNTDILISATTAPHLLVHESDFPPQRDMLVIDLAMPRDVDERIGLLPGVKLFNIEMIEKTATQNIDQRRHIVAKAENIIHQEVLDCVSVFRTSP